MRILFVVQNYPPETGPVRYTRDLAVGLSARGHEVTVVTGLPHYPTGRPTPEFGRFRPSSRWEDGVRVIRTPLLMASNQQLVRRVIGWLTFVGSAFPWTMSKPRPDVLVASIPPFTVAGLGLLSARLRRIPLVLMLRDVEPLVSLQFRGLDGHILARPAIKAAMAMYRRGDHIVVTHESQRESLLDYKPMPPSETITHGIDVDRFLQGADQPDPIDAMCHEGKRRAIYVGTVGAAHGIPSLISAFGHPSIRSMPVELIVVGDGEDKQACRRKIEDLNLRNVKLVPPVSLEQVPAVVCGADLLVCSYQTRDRAVAGMIGSKFYEYLAAGKPLLVNGMGVASELVRHIGNGWVCNSDNPDTLVSALTEFLSNPEKSARMGLEGRKYAREHFDVHERHDRWESLLQEFTRGEHRAKA